MGAWAFALGMLLGLISGLVPGLHSNTVISILDSTGLEPETAALIIIALYPASIIASFIPSIFLGIPEDPSVVSALAGQRMASEGRGIGALCTMAASAVLASALSAALFVPSGIFYEVAYSALRPFIGPVLLALCLCLVLRSRSPGLSCLFFILSGILGKLVLGLGLEDPFLPLFGGMFALGSLLGAGGRPLPAQKDEPAWGGFPAPSALGVVLGLLSNLLPGIGSSAQMAALSSSFVRMGTFGYLSLISSISVSQAIFSLSSAASIGKGRNGAVVWLLENSDVAGGLGSFLALFLLSAALTAMAVYWGRGVIARRLSDASGLGMAIAIYICAITIVIDGMAGMACLGASAALGLLCARAGAERTSLMGAIIVPTLMLLFGVFT